MTSMPPFATKRTGKAIAFPILLSLVSGVAIACQAPAPLSTPSPPRTTRTTVDHYGIIWQSPLGFQFTYPMGFVVQAEEWPDTGATGVKRMVIWTQKDFETLPSRLGQGTEYPPNVEIRVYRRSTGEDLQRWISNHQDFLQPQDFQQANVAGRAAIAFKSTGLYEFEHIAVVNPAGDRIIVISWAKEADYEPAFRQIVSTLQFD